MKLQLFNKSNYFDFAISCNYRYHVELAAATDDNDDDDNMRFRELKLLVSMTRSMSKFYALKIVTKRFFYNISNGIIRKNMLQKTGYE